MHDILIATIGVFLGELYGNFVGGGSLLTQTVLQQILHFDIKSAMALDNTAAIGSNIGMLLVLLQKYRPPKWFWLFLLFSMLGSFLGAKVLIFIDEDLLKIFFALSILAVLLKNFTKKPSRKNKNHPQEPSQISLWYLLPIAFFVGFYNAAFVIGDWIFSLLLLTSVLHLHYAYAIFVLSLTLLFSQPLATYQYLTHQLLDPHFALPMVIATFLGGILSALLLTKIKEAYLKTLLNLLGILLALYLLYGIFK